MVTLSYHRENQRGGGTAIIYKSCYTVNRMATENKFNTFECTTVFVQGQSNKKIAFVIIYKNIVIIYRTGPIS